MVALWRKGMVLVVVAEEEGDVTGEQIGDGGPCGGREWYG